MSQSEQYAALKKLRAGETLDFEGVELVMDGDGTGLKPGDTYIAQRNMPPKLLTVKKINEDRGCVVPTTFDYSYGLGECVKVKLAEA